VLGLPESIRAILFDLDGVLTDTASVHKKAWQMMFDEFLADRSRRTGEPFVAFDPVDDYLQYVDGKKREDGVRSFLASRGIDLPEGDPSDGPEARTVFGLGNRKNENFHRVLQTDGITVFDGSRRYLEAAADAGYGTAVVSSSANTREVLERTGLDKFIQHRVDGVVLREQNIRGKPAPDSFLRAAELLGVTPAQAAVYEDALSGVQAGRAGNFGFVVGVDRVGQAEELRRNGADVVVTDLEEMLTQ
jgi:beta-phosphoglucomutase family hydrolase